MGIVVDLIIIMFIFACVFFGYKKGLVKLGIHLVSFVVAILVTFILYRPIADLVINYTNIDESIENSIMEKIDSKEAEGDIVDQFKENAKDTLLIQTVRPLTYNIIYTVIMIILFVVSKIALIIISSFTDVITSLPVIKQFNKTGGVLYGIIVGFFVVYLMLFMLSFINQINNKEIQGFLNETIITKTMYENNILSVFFNNIGF